MKGFVGIVKTEVETSEETRFKDVHIEAARDKKRGSGWSKYNSYMTAMAHFRKGINKTEPELAEMPAEAPDHVQKSGPEM